MCPRQYEHRYILGTPPSHRSGALAFGSAIHTALALFYRRIMDQQPEPSLEELESSFADSWAEQLGHPTPVLLDEKETEDSLNDMGVALVRVFHAQAERPHQVLAVEEPFSVEITNPTKGEVFEERLVGAIDAVVMDADGQTRILEHKTASRRWTEDKQAYDLQVTAYALIAPMIGFDTAQVNVQLFLKQKKPAIEIINLNRTSQDKRDLMQIINGCLISISAGAFYPRRDWQCRGCAYSGPCLAG
jgi:putative RecB family exonuclease